MSKLAQYRNFVAIVENGSFQGAARELLASPSTVSKQLAKLEADVNTHLIDRTTHSLSVTPIGHDFYLRCKDILSSVQEAEAYLKNVNDEPLGKLTIELPEALLKTSFADVLEGFANTYPNIKYDIVLSNSPVDIVANNVDFSLRMGPLADSRLTAISLSPIKLCFCTSPAYIKKHGRPAFNKLISDKHLIIPAFAEVPIIARLLNIGDDEPPEDLKHLHSTNAANASIDMALAGLGVIVIVESAVKQFFDSGQLVRLFPKQEIPSVELSLVYHRRDYLPENMRLFKNYVKSNFTLK